MKKLVLFSVLLLGFSSLICFSKDDAPDPLYLATPPLDASKIEVKMKEKDPRTLKEKMRAKLHLPPSKKVYIHNIDRTNQPITVDDYHRMAADKPTPDQFGMPRQSTVIDPAMSCHRYGFQITASAERILLDG